MLANGERIFRIGSMVAESNAKILKYESPFKSDNVPKTFP